MKLGRVATIFVSVQCFFVLIYFFVDTGSSAPAPTKTQIVELEDQELNDDIAPVENEEQRHIAVFVVMEDGPSMNVLLESKDIKHPLVPVIATHKNSKLVKKKKNPLFSLSRKLMRQFRQQLNFWKMS